MTTGQIEDMQRLYATRLFNPQAWYRLLTFKADYRLIWRMVTHAVRKRLAPPPTDDNANPLVPPAVFSMLSSKRPLLLVFGGSDRLQWEFEEKFVARHQERLAALPPLCDVHVVKFANHVLSTAEWQQEMLEVSAAWLRRRFERDVQRETATPALA